MKKLVSSLTFSIFALAMMFLFGSTTYGQASVQECAKQFQMMRQAGMDKAMAKASFQECKERVKAARQNGDDEDEEIDEDEDFEDRDGNRAGNNRIDREDRVTGQERAHEVQSSMMKDGDDTDDDDDKVKEDKDKNKNKNKNNNNNGQKGNKKP
jgi:hypothetical protein